MLLFLFLVLLKAVNGFIHPLMVQGRYFVDTVTNEPFYIKGVDYQPGGSSGVVDHRDPLSDPKICARDIFLFQNLGINTIRVYSVNSDLDHDKCMSMLAAAGIYLVLDVNSPVPNHHLNRYEPWNSYTVEYLENIFKVIEQFSTYNNTLGFFAGNEVINDETSAKNSAVYMKALVRDIKTYIDVNSPREIPIGYSAADDLKFRMSMSQYLECIEDSPFESVDFYGVNSYQWCGDQSFFTSGYNTLVDDYATYTQPVFLSEYGCNEVTPRKFGEVHSIYSNDMIDVFSGGLVYEFTQESNNYGLVKVLENGDATLLPDYFALKGQFDSLPEIDYYHVSQAMKDDTKDIANRKKVSKFGLPICDSSYANIQTEQGLPKSVGEDLIEYGVKVERGRFVELSEEELTCELKIFDTRNNEVEGPYKVEPAIDYMSGIGYDKLGRIRFRSGTYNDLEDSDSEYDTTYSDSDDVGDEGAKENLMTKCSGYIKKMFDSVASFFSNPKMSKD